VAVSYSHAVTRDLLPTQQGVAKPLVTAVLPAVQQCLSHTCHGVRLAAVSCLVRIVSIDGAIVPSLMASLLRTLTHTHGHITSPAVIAATAATAFALSTAATKPLTRTEKLKQSLRFGKAKEGAVLSYLPLWSHVDSVARRSPLLIKTRSHACDALDASSQ
jgi:hypothetical protein